MGNRRARTKSEFIDMFLNQIEYDTNGGCWLWSRCVDPDGYGMVSYDFGDGKKAHKTHRVSYQIHFGKVPEGFVVRHKCDVPACVNPSHLVIGTQFDNIQDRVLRGRNGDIKGIRHPNSTLTEKDVLWIRSLRNPDIQKIAKQYDVSYQAIQKVIDRITWKHI